MYTRKHSRKFRKAIAGAIFAACISLAGQSNAGQYAWTGGGGSLNTGWNVPANWASNSMPVSSGSTIVTFQNSSPGNFQNIANPLMLNRLWLNAGINTTTSGNALDFHNDPTWGDAPYILTQSDLPNTINNNIVLSNNVKIYGPGTGAMLLQGNISGAGLLDCNQPGLVRLSGNNTHTGGTQVDGGGELQVTGASALGTGVLTLQSGSSFSATAPVTVPNALDLFNFGTISFKGASDITFNGPVNIYQATKWVDVNSGITTRFNGVVSNTAGMIKTGGGTLLLAGNDTFSGGINVNSGTLAIGAQDVLPANSDITVYGGGALTLQANFGNGNSNTPSKPVNSVALDYGLMRVPASSGDFWLNQLTFTAGTLDLSGSSLFWMHFTGAKPALTTNPAADTAVIGGGSLCQLRNNSADTLLFNVGAGTTASGIDLDVTAQLVTLGGAFQKSGSGVMRLSGTGSSGKIILDGGTLRFDDPLALPSGGSIDIAGGILQYGGSGSVSATSKVKVVGGWIDVPNPQATANFSNGIGGGGTLHKTGAGTLSGQNFRLAVMQVQQGNARVMPDGTAAGTSNVFSLTLAPGSKFDLTNNALVTDATGINHFNDVVNLIKSGYANASWTGTGFMSSTAAANPGHALGVVKATDLFANFPATWMGQSITADKVLVRYTLSGDANLDGAVDTVDFNDVAASFSQSGKTWFNGDFNYDGSVDTVDFNLLASNFGQILPADPVGMSVGALVPEPDSMIFIGASFLLVRRRRVC